MSEPPRAEGADPEKTTWIGRARPVPPRAPPTDPYWPPVDATPVPYVDYEQGYSPTLVRPPRRRRTAGTVLLVLMGMFTLCCGGGIALAYALNGGFAGEDLVGPAPPGLNTPATDGEFTFVVTALNCGEKSVGRSIVTKKAKGVFCIVDLEVENTGTKPQNFADAFQKLLGADGTVYDADIAAGLIANESIAGLWSSIDPGSKVSGKIVYDVPAEARIAKVELHDSPLSEGVTITL